MKVLPILAAAAALLMTSAEASAQTATDARCIILSNAFAKAGKDADAQKLAEATLYFYLGRINMTSGPQLKALLDQQVKTITDATAGDQMNECVKGLQAKMQLMQSLAPPPAATTTPPKKPEGR